MTRRAPATLLLLLLLTPLVRGQKDGMEEFEPVDPYTKGDSERMAKLGYVSYGPFAWRGAVTTNVLRETLGDPPILWVETEHFRIGSTLGTYKVQGDQEEKARIKEEVARLKAKLGKMKAPKNELDPWLRLHVYAQRCEDLAEAFERDFKLKASDYQDTGANLGQKHKFLVLLCERSSELGRYAQDATGAKAQFAWRYGWGTNEGMFFGISYEAITAAWTSTVVDYPYDSILHSRLVAGVTANLVEGYRANNANVPCWLTYGLSYLYGRRIAPRWVTTVGDHGGSAREDEWEWEPRVYNLVKNDYFASSEDLFGWTGPGDMNKRDHLIAWSRLDYLLREGEGDLAAFLGALCVKPMQEGTDKAARVALQTAALKEHLGLTPSELDKAWARWVKKKYRKR